MLGLGASLTTGGAPLGISNNYSIDFDGGDDYIDIGASTIDISGQYSVSLWFKTTDLTTNYLYSLGNDDYARIGSATSIYIKMGTNAVSFGGSDALTTMGSGAWVNIVITRNGSNVNKIYINGSLETDASNQITQSSNLKIRYLGKKSSSYYDGNLDEFAVWNTELDGDSISTIYNAKGAIDLTENQGNYDEYTDKLKGWWRMGDGTEKGAGTTIYDMSDEGNNGTWSGASGGDNTAINYDSDTPS